MSQARQQPMTPAEFLAWEARQDMKWEFDGGQPVAMNGVSVAHSVVQTNLTTAVSTRLRGTPCRAFGPSLKVEIGRKYRYPDLLVSCAGEAAGAHVVTAPVVIFEILARDGVLALPEIGITVPVAELYEGMEFEPLTDVEETR